MYGLEGKHVVISGAGGGIGRALVATFKAAGARVTACDRDPALLAALDGVEAQAFELTDRAAVTAAAEAILARTGTPDVIVSNAGGSRAEAMADVTAEAWDDEIAGNLTGGFNLVSAFLPAMMAAGGGAIVFTSTVNSLAHYGNPAYSAAKAGLNAYARSIAVEMGRVGIRANLVCPGSVRTRAWDLRLEKNPGLMDEVSKHYPLGRLVVPEEVANAALFLASPLASGITGVALPVDAGLTAGNLRFVREIIGG